MARDAMSPPVAHTTLEQEHGGHLRRTVTNLIGAGILLIMSCALCSASTIVLSCTSVGPLPTELNTSLDCPQFNVLGTLNSMSLEVDGAIMGSITLTNNDSTSAQTGSGTTSSEFHIGSLTGFTILSPLFTASFSTNSQTLGPSQTQTFSGLSGSGGATITNTTSFIPYTGGGTFAIPITTLSGFSVIGGGGNFAGSQSTQATATALVTYNFDETSEVPEPVTAMLTGGALLCLGFVSRRRLVKLKR